MAKGESPFKRSKRYARELKSGKNELTGAPLTKGQKSFRYGVLNERKWGFKILGYKKSKNSNQNVSGKQTNSNNPYDDFDYDSYGNIKGSYIDGRFEPD